MWNHYLVSQLFLKRPWTSGLQHVARVPSSWTEGWWGRMGELQPFLQLLFSHCPVPHSCTVSNSFALSVLVCQVGQPPLSSLRKLSWGSMNRVSSRVHLVTQVISLLDFQEFLRCSINPDVWLHGWPSAPELLCDSAAPTWKVPLLSGSWRGGEVSWAILRFPASTAGEIHRLSALWGAGLLSN